MGRHRKSEGVPKQLASPVLTGGGGLHFEEDVQASFAVLMLTGGFAPALRSTWPIFKIKVQGRHADYDTDDLIVFVREPGGKRERKLLGQVKHSLALTKGDSTFGEVLGAGWRDFNNERLFRKGRGGDVIALITGPLSGVDTDSVRPMLERVRQVESSEEFFRDIELGQFTSKDTRTKLEGIKFHLKQANGGVDLSSDELFEFLRHFHLLIFDLDIKAGVNIALLHTVVANHTGRDAEALWAKLVMEIRSANQTAGTITPNSLPDELVEEFRKEVPRTMPRELAPKLPAKSARDWAVDPKARSLAKACLLGEWQEGNPRDKEVIQKLVGTDWDRWRADLQAVLQDPQSPIQLRNGHWMIKDRFALWAELSNWIFDDDLDAIGKMSVSVLSEIDPKMEIPPDEREFSLVSKTDSRVSGALRKGLAATLAFLGNRGEVLGHCSLHLALNTATDAIRLILDNADANRWGSLNDVLPILAEAVPREFLNAIDVALTSSPCPFEELFSQEGKGIFGQNFMTGVLWGLESLAWRKDHLAQASICLAGLGDVDPGGRWANRPLNSLTSILLPWFPQTLAPFETRLASVRTMQRDFPNVAWNLLLSLLPRTHSSSSGTHKPKWLELSDSEANPKVSVTDYWKEVGEYAGLALEMAKIDTEHLQQLVEHADHLPHDSQDGLVTYLVSEFAPDAADDQKRPIWERLVRIISKHRRYSGAKWAMPASRVEILEVASEALAPRSPRALHRRLFIPDEYSLYEEGDDWEAQRERVQERRNNAVSEIEAAEGLDGVREFAKEVESPYWVGYSLGCVSDQGADRHFLPSSFANTDQSVSQFLQGFISARHDLHGWTWVDGLDRSEWSETDTVELLTKLPFTDGTWIRASSWLDKGKANYWQSVQPFPYQASGDLLSAIDMLLEVHRPVRAIECLYARHHRGEPLDVRRTVAALIAGVRSDEPIAQHYHFELIELIGALQNDPTSSFEDLVQIEWAYLRLLDSHSGGRPITLHRKLATESGFFCEVIRLIYRSTYESNESAEEPDAETKDLASRAWQLLHDWRRPPGIRDDDTFSGEHFRSWIEEMIRECTETGHLEIGLEKAGEVLFFCPPEDDGSLWIDRAVADVLNGADAEPMRSGFTTQAFNYRGVHAVDHSGKEELKFAREWYEKAEVVENEGFLRFAVALRRHAEYYERDAQRIRAVYGERE